MTDNLIVTEENEDLFPPGSPRPGGSKKDDFDPPPLLDEEKLLRKSPTIKFMTPVPRPKAKRNKVFVDEEEDEDEGFHPPEPTFSTPVRTPKIDLTDDDDINDHVRKLVSCPGPVDYSKEPEKIKELCEDVFRSKFNSLSMNYKQYRSIEYPEDRPLNKIHKYYHDLIKNIYVNMSISQYETYYMLTLLALEFLAVNIFHLPLEGYTKSEMKRMYRYKALLIELGEAFYPDGTGEQSSIEWRLFWAMGFNIVVFLVVKIVSEWVIGDDSMKEGFRAVIEQLVDNPITKENIESGEANDISEQNDSFIGDILGGSSLKDFIVEVGSEWNENTAQERKKHGKRSHKQKVVWGN
jgi:hypothetical protein